MVTALYYNHVYMIAVPVYVYLYMIAVPVYVYLYMIAVPVYVYLNRFFVCFYQRQQTAQTGDDNFSNRKKNYDLIHLNIMLLVGLNIFVRYTVHRKGLCAA